MSILKKLFFGLNLTWPKIVIMAVIAGVVTGLIMMCPALENTSIHNIGVTMEMWIFLAMIICSNSEKWWEAGLKTFVFFLISQPLVYLTMWPVYQCFPWNYYMYWLYWTIATLPMGCLAWYIKKGNALSVAILAVPCIFLALLGAGALCRCIAAPPNYLLTALFCFAQVIMYVAAMLDGKAKRLIVGGLSLVAAAGFLVFSLCSGPGSSLSYGFDNADTCTYEVADESIVVFSSANENFFTLDAKGYGSTTLKVTKEDGTVVIFDITVDPQNNSVNAVPRE